MATEGWVSITSTLDRSTRWPEDHTCSARADVTTSPFLSARRCSVRRCFKVRPDCPTSTNLDTQNRGSGIQLLCAGPWVHGYRVLRAD